MTEQAKKALNSLAELPRTERYPVLFIGHGSPTNAIEDNAYTRGWEELGKSIPTPKAVLVVSAHWLSDRTEVDVSERPQTIYDYYGFPDEMYALKYPAPGCPALARDVGKTLLSKVPVIGEEARGLDHGAWVVLKRMYREADISTFQLAIDYPKGAAFHYELGALLRPLRERGVLILGSGNIVHNLPLMKWQAREGGEVFDWAREFDEKAKSLVEKGDHDALIAYEKVSTGARLAVPTPDHYWPFLYALGAAGKDEKADFPVEGIDFASVSMRAVRWG